VVVKINGEPHYLWRAVGSRRRSSWKFCDEGQGQARCADVSEEGHASVRFTQIARYRRSPLIRRCYGWNRKPEMPGGRPASEQPSC